MTFAKWLFALLMSSGCIAAEHINILIYHHVADDTPASTTISPAQFRAHLQLLKDQQFQVIDLTTALDAMQNGTSLPEKSVAITFDDGYQNIYHNAWPLLKEFNYPFTLFVATDAIDEKRKNILTWDQLRQMKQAGVTIANHSSDHGYLVRTPTYSDAWLALTQANIEHAQRRIAEELGADTPKWFAYPYGEFAQPLKEKLKAMGYIGFAQHSGGFWQGSDLQAIPRFAAAGIYANPKTLLTKLYSRPMPVNEATLADMPTSNRQPVLLAELVHLDNLSKGLNCFVDGQWQDASWANQQAFTLQAEAALSPGRHRYNCTSKAVNGDYYYWYSKPWLVLEPAN